MCIPYGKLSGAVLPWTADSCLISSTPQLTVHSYSSINNWRPWDHSASAHFTTQQIFCSKTSVCKSNRWEAYTYKRENGAHVAEYLAKHAKKARLKPVKRVNKMRTNSTTAKPLHRKPVIFKVSFIYKEFGESWKRLHLRLPGSRNALWHLALKFEHAQLAASVVWKYERLLQRLHIHTAREEISLWSNNSRKGAYVEQQCSQTHRHVCCLVCIMLSSH